MSPSAVATPTPPLRADDFLYVCRACSRERCGGGRKTLASIFFSFSSARGAFVVFLFRRGAIARCFQFIPRWNARTVYKCDAIAIVVDFFVEHLFVKFLFGVGEIRQQIDE